MHFAVLDSGSDRDHARWIASWNRWPAREPWAHPEYARLFARPGDRVVCAAGEDAGGEILMPLILRPISAEPWAATSEPRLDATSPYGYGGPFAWGAGPRDDRAFWSAYEAWCRDERVVATFLRLSLFPQQLAALPAGVEGRLQNIVVPLTTPEALWKGYEGKIRRWVGVAERAGLTVEVDLTGARLADFQRIYAHTMERNRADAWYSFPRAFFTGIVERLPGQYVFFHALARGEVVSSDLLLCSTEHVYYFLGGTHADAFPLGPNYLLKHRIASWALAQGKKRYVLGGGYAAGDGLFRYKRAYARQGEVPFRVAALVHDEDGCRDLTAQRARFAAAAGDPWSPRPGFFPIYRA